MALHGDAANRDKDALAGEPARPVRILAVDDSPSIRSLVGSLLAGAGYEVDVADSGEAAIQLAIADPPDVVVSDVSMGAISGVQLCRLLRADARTSHLPVILLTAADDPRSKFWARTAGATAYVTKKSMIESLLPAIGRVLESSPSAPSGAKSEPRTRIEPLAHLARVLDELLFQAIVAAEVRRLLDDADDRARFARALLTLASELSDFACAVLRLDGLGRGSWSAYLRRGPSPDALAQALVEAGVCGPGARIDVIEDASRAQGDEGGLGPAARFPLQAKEEVLGELLVFGGSVALSREDLATFALLAREVVVVVKAAFLMEETRLRLEELVATRDQLLHAEKVATAAEMAAGVAHEVNNPLAFLQSNLTTLRDYSSDLREAWRAAEQQARRMLDAKDPAGVPFASRVTSAGLLFQDVQEVISESMEGVRRIGELVAGFRQLAAPPNPTGIESVLLWQVVEGCERFAEGPGQLRHRVMELKGDRALRASLSQEDLRSSVLNILSYLAAPVREEPSLQFLPVRVAIDAPDGVPTLTITDSRLELSSEARARVLDPRIALDPVDGRRMRLDIGLALAFQLLRRNGAELRVENASGGGTAFRLLLPKTGGP
jgi:DNA-binding response OmpR family regulator